MNSDELAPAFKGRPHLDSLWQKIARGCAEFTPEEQVEISVAKARVLQSRGDFPLALKHGLNALQLAEQSNDNHGSVAALANLSYSYFNCNNYSEASHYARQALERASDAPDSVQALNTLGLIAFDTDDWLSASKYFEQAIRLSRQTGDKFFWSVTLLEDDFERAEIELRPFDDETLRVSKTFRVFFVECAGGAREKSYRRVFTETRMIYQFVDEQRSSHSVRRRCQGLRVSTSGYYACAWRSFSLRLVQAICDAVA